MKKLWDTFSDNFGETIIHPQFLMLRQTRKAITEAKRYAVGKLIDIGAGRMPYRKELETKVSSYTAVDHPTTSKLYKGEIKPEVLADVKNLPFDDNSFDIALMLQVLEYLDEPQTALNETARVLKKNGVLILTSPFLYPIHDQPYDRNRFTDQALRAFLKNAGFKIIKLEAQGNFWDFWFLSLNVHLMRRIKDRHILVPALLLLTPPTIVIGNLLGILASRVSAIQQRQNYFPLNYLAVAKKTG